MIEHSSIDSAEIALDIAAHASCRSQDEQDAILEIVEEADKRLLMTYLGGQEPGVPLDWRIGWYECRHLLQALDKAKTKLDLRLRASKFFTSQMRAEKRRKAEATDERWLEIGDYDAMLHAQHQGFDVRTLMVGRKTTYQYASRKEISKGSTQL
jgi:hypothetical protein